MHLTIIITFKIQNLYNFTFFTILKSNVGFWREGKTRVPAEKPLGAEKRTNKLSPFMTLSLGIEPGTHWWKTSTLTTAPTHSPINNKFTEWYIILHCFLFLDFSWIAVFILEICLGWSLFLPGWNWHRRNWPSSCQPVSTIQYNMCKQFTDIDGNVMVHVN